MTASNPPVDELRNIGPTIARRLREVGIRTRRDLKTAGPVEAFHRIRDRHPRQSIPVCYYLYSLEGALKDVHWDDLGTNAKSRLRRRAGIA